MRAQRIGSGTLARQQHRVPVAHLSQDKIGRRCAVVIAWTSLARCTRHDSTVQPATRTRPISGLPPISATKRMIMFGLRRAVISRNRERSEEHTSELQSLMRISYAVFCLKKKKKK